jgi:hypothetical protein
MGAVVGHSQISSLNGVSGLKPTGPDGYIGKGPGSSLCSLADP